MVPKRKFRSDAEGWKKGKLRWKEEDDKRVKVCYNVTFLKKNLVK